MCPRKYTGSLLFFVRYAIHPAGRGTGPTKLECGGVGGGGGGRWEPRVSLPAAGCSYAWFSVASEALGGEGLLARAGSRWKLNIEVVAQLVR